MKFFLAGIATAFLYWFVNRYTTFVDREFTTQNNVDPATVPGATPLADSGEMQETVDAATIRATNAVTLPMAQIASSFGAQVSPNPLNPVIPAMGYGNTYLDLPQSVYNSN